MSIYARNLGPMPAIGLGDLRGRAGPQEGHPLTYAKKGYATLKATVEQAGFKLA